MKGKRFSEEQIIRILHEAESLDNVREVCRQHNIAEQTLYRWRRQFGGMEVTDIMRALTGCCAMAVSIAGCLRRSKRLVASSTTG